ncbi:AAA family ATPase [Limnothrix sp. FACHB-881]|uniref:AAA family ATPase n=1 Tax=Limnothrix sp. FACHB-881 TaxID=2692819 RepID=UPI0016845705|nr:AAA family ATPase [Limnothrix sp. FACHB-881]MBD2634126.1 AAA family ATPase [Limnothrix sp. FACHB-881]
MAKNHLDNLTIHKFRGLRDLELKDLGQVNLLVGENNCGKTSVLEAVNLYCNPLDLREWISTIRRREGDVLRFASSPIELLQWIFAYEIDSDQEVINQGKISIDGLGKFIVRNLDVSCEAIEEIQLTGSDEEQSPSSEDDVMYDGKGSDLRRGIELNINLSIESEQVQLWSQFKELAPVKIQLWENQALRLGSAKSKSYRLSTSNITLPSHRSETAQALLYSAAMFDELQEHIKQDIVDIMQELDHNIQDILMVYSRPQGEATSRRPKLHIRHTKLGLVPVSIFGDGVRRWLHIALTIFQAKNGILLIDEIESAIHTEALQNIFAMIAKWSKKLNVQVFATTHSLEAIDAMIDAADSASDLVLYRLEPTETKTRVVRHDWERLKRLRENLGQEVRW